MPIKVLSSWRRVAASVLLGEGLPGVGRIHTRWAHLLSWTSLAGEGRLTQAAVNCAIMKAAHGGHVREAGAG